MDSGYPTRDVVKTASPEMLALAPNALPWKTGPPRMVKVAGSASAGAVARGVKGIFLPLLPVVAAWPEENRAWAGARRAEA